MVRHPSVHPARVLSKLAAYMHKLHGKSLTDYVLSVVYGKLLHDGLDSEALELF